jgi:hypothetical protein
MGNGKAWACPKIVPAGAERGQSFVQFGLDRRLVAAAKKLSMWADPVA